MGSFGFSTFSLSFNLVFEEESDGMVVDDFPLLGLQFSLSFA